MDSELLHLIFGSDWPIVVALGLVLAYFLARYLRYLTHIERCLQSRSKPESKSDPETPTPAATSEAVAGNPISNQPTLPNDKNVRAEYSALISYHNSIVTHRFTLLGFFLATVGILAKDGMDFHKALLILIITGPLYIVERRNRFLYTQMAKRAMQIEEIHWRLIKRNEKGKIAELPLFCRFRPNELLLKLKREDLTGELEKELKTEIDSSLKKSLKFWFWICRQFTSHSRGLDLLYAAVAIYAILCVIGVIPQKEP